MRTEQSIRAANKVQGDPHLRSSDEVKGYRIHASDGEIGHVEDFILEDEEWRIRYLVVDTGKWLPGKKVLVAPMWIKDILWADSMVVVNLTKEEIENSPPYSPELPINRDYEEVLYDYYGRPKYWVTH